MEETRLVLEQAKPVLALGFANLDWPEIFVVIGAMIISFATSTWLHYILRKNKSGGANLFPAIQAFDYYFL